MIDRPMPDRTPQSEAAQEARQAREAAALRANLLRRKAQLRARTAQADLPVEPLSDRPSDPDPS
ncbi:MAG: hypothetical protein H7Z10_04060 [Gemmatimonadaceae bacterium]|nr:hypothetical protein [Acetobacteraceae bacterium]